MTGLDLAAIRARAALAASPRPSWMAPGSTRADRYELERRIFTTDVPAMVSRIEELERRLSYYEARPARVEATKGETNA